MTRGRLPARVYWVRRLMVLGIATLLVVGIARLLGGSSDGASSDDQAVQDSFARCWASEDVREAAAARDERRTPVFRGR